MEPVCTKPVFLLLSFGDMDMTSPLILSTAIPLSFMILSILGQKLQTRDSQRLNEQVRSASWTSLANLFATLCITVLLTLVLECGVITARSLNDNVWTSLLAEYVAGTFAAWILCLWTLVDGLNKFGHEYRIQYIFWLVALVTETSVGWVWIQTIKHPVKGSVWTLYDRVHFGAFITRYTTLWVLVILSTAHMFSGSSASFETSQLLNTNAATPYSGYNATADSTQSTTSKEPDSIFTDFYKNMVQLMPFLWPQNNRRLQCLVVLSFGLMVLGLVINACIPYQIGHIVDHTGKGTFTWSAVLIYVGFKFLQGGSGLIQWVQNLCWIPVNQYTTRTVSLMLFEHLHLLSLSYHLERKTGQILRVMDRGTSSVALLLSQVLFQIIPAIANILVAVVLISATFSLGYGAIVFVTMVLYLYVTIKVSEKRIKLWRATTELDNSTRAYALDSLINFETVKYYGNSVYEVGRYHDAFVEYQKASWKSSMSLNVLSLAQHMVITAGLFVGCILLAYEISLGQLTSGDFVIFNMYMMQLYSPLQLFGNYYRLMQVSFVDMEKMLELLRKQLTVKDIADAPNIIMKEGIIKFDNVTFTYDNRQTILKGVSFTVQAGSTVALVGPTGSGKSTIMRLLFRFYDPTSGAITIDRQNIRNVRQSSLRHNIGVVPQDCVLFNDTIMYNLKYGNIHASAMEVHEAAKAAQIHDTILSFPEGYNTIVGERGLRLSTGEKQRVAIARTILKNPPIILLDEATSSLDTLTEMHIQKALSNVTRNRTTVVVAHRLSTIVNADQILVIEDGLVVESGTHEDLLKQGNPLNTTNHGVYWEMWQKQLFEDNIGTPSFTLGDNETMADVKDEVVATGDEESYLANKINSTPTFETHGLSQNQKQHDTAIDLVTESQQLQNIDNDCTNGNQAQEESYPKATPHLDTSLQSNQHGALIPDDQLEADISPPVELSSQQNNDDDQITAPVIDNSLKNQQSAGGKSNKPRPRSKNKKRRNFRNSTSFS